MNNLLALNFGVAEHWFSIYATMNYMLTIPCIMGAAYFLFFEKQMVTRPSFILALLIIVLYQIPLAIFSPVIYQNLFSAIWFAISIHTAVISNLMWIYFTPKLNADSIKTNTYVQYSATYFRGFLFWFPSAIFFLFLGLYLYKIPFSCTAFYSLLMDQEISLLVREVLGKLLGANYAPHILNIMTSAIGPILAFFLSGRIYYDFKEKEYICLPLWVLMLVIVLVSPLLGGAKGSLVPMAVALSVVSFIVAKKWKYKILLAGGLFLLFAFMILVVKVAQESGSGNGRYQFGSCIARLNACSRTKVLLESLRPPKAYYGVSRARLNVLGEDLLSFCDIDNIKYTEIKDKGGTTLGMPIIASLSEHVMGMLHRVFVSPIQVAYWHFLYVDENGSPKLYGITLAKLFSDNYVSVPAKVCELYYLGDKTSACTAPTSYLFTYPAYLGWFGLLFACFLSLSFDIVFSLLIKYSPKPIVDLTLGIITIAAVNFIAADFVTVVVSHGVGVAFVMLLTMSWYCSLSNKYR